LRRYLPVYALFSPVLRHTSSVSPVLSPNAAAKQVKLGGYAVKQGQMGRKPTDNGAKHTANYGGG
jgi:hypothetical protein